MQDFAPEDLYLHQRIVDVHCVATARAAVAEVRSVDREHDTYVSCIWAFPLDGQPARQLTRGPGRDRSPRWSPDGRLVAFTSGRAGGAPQAYVLEAAGGEARQLTNFELGVTQLAWSPDARSLLATVAIPSDPDARGKATGTPRGANEPEVCWRLPYKMDGVGYMLDREIHLFRIPLDGGEPQQLTRGTFDVQAFEASPNGRHIAFSRTREGRFAHRTDLWACDADGSRARLLCSELSMTMKPAWSPDGRWIAFGGAREEGDAQARCWLLEFGSGQLRQLGSDDLELADSSQLFWDANGEHLYAARAFRGRHEVVRLSIPGGEADVLCTGFRQFGALAFDGHRFAFGVESPAQPSELFACDLQGAHERQVTDLNRWWKERPRIEVQSREFEVPDGRGGMETIHGWLLRDPRHAQPQPLLDDAHGGPASYALLDYESNVYWQVLCAKGWAVLLLNPVGSASYGREFLKRLSGHWGEYDLPQHEAAIARLRAEGVCDDRIAICGKSYGGYFSSWAIGHTRTFRAAVVMAPVGNIETHYGTSDGGYYADPLYVGGTERFDRQRARELSPLQFIERAVTPTLFLQGKEDERCPKCQSEELFVSLHRAGETPAQLVLYPGEDHHFLSDGRPTTRVDAAQRIERWVREWVARPPGADTKGRC